MLPTPLLEAAHNPHLPTYLQVLARVKSVTGHATVPLVFVGGQLLGGAAELTAALADGSMQRRMEGASGTSLPAELQQILQSKGAAQGAAADDAVAAAAEVGSERGSLRQLATELRNALASASRDRSFSLQQAMEWVQQQQACTPEAAAAALAELQAAQLLAVAVPAGSRDAELPLSLQLAQQRPHLQLRLVADVPPPRRWAQPLNGQYAWFGPARPAEQVCGRCWVAARGQVVCSSCNC